METEAKIPFNLFKYLGGRKNANGYLYSILISTIGPYKMSETITFDAYALWLFAALISTSAIVAWEDRSRTK